MPHSVNTPCSHAVYDVSSGRCFDCGEKVKDSDLDGVEKKIRDVKGRIRRLEDRVAKLEEEKATWR